MEVLLLQDIPKLGSRGEVVKVADGYARNYLIPKNLAVKLTPSNMKQLEYEKKKLEQQRAKEEKQLRELADKLSSISVTIPVKVNEEGHLFGSVTREDIAKALLLDEIEIDPEVIQLESPIKEKGVYEIEFKLSPTISTKVKVWVVAE